LQFNIAQLQTDKQFKQYENLIVSLFNNGYREMPLDMKNLIVNRLQKDSMGFIMTDHTPKGFQSINPSDDRYATLSNGIFDEVHEPKLIEQYNHTLLNTQTRKISKFVASDTLYNKYNFDPVVFAWCIDPLAAKYPYLSPYVAFADNPILFFDNDGRKIYDANGKPVEITITTSAEGVPTAKYNFDPSTTEEQRNQFYANAGVIVDAMIFTPEGLTDVERMNKSNGKINMVFEKDLVKVKDGSLLGGYTDPIIETPVKEEDGSYVYQEVTITVYKKAYDMMQGTEPLPPEVKYKPTKSAKIYTALSKFINGMGVHESKHQEYNYKLNKEYDANSPRRETYSNRAEKKVQMVIRKNYKKSFSMNFYFSI
jgi:hypothetical protein